MAYEVIEVAGYWRLRKDRVLVSTHDSRETALAAMTLAKVADKVLAYRVPARTKKAKKRARKRRQIRRESCI